MNNDKDKYAGLIDRIKALQPQLPDRQRLISNTMNRIELLPKKKEHNRILTIVSWASSIAASFLTGMLLFESFLFTTNKELTSSKIVPVYTVPVFEKNIENPTTLNEFSKMLSIKKGHRNEQRAFYSIFFNKYKIL